jgi:hypothetical protein
VDIFDAAAGSCDARLIPVMETTDFRDFDHETKLRRLYGP